MLELSSVMKMDLQVLETLQNLKTMTVDGAIGRASEGSKILSGNSAAAWKTISGAKTKELCMVYLLEVVEYPLPSGVFVESFQLVVTKKIRLTLVEI
jgi:hypothetical protein